MSEIISIKQKYINEQAGTALRIYQLKEELKILEDRMAELKAVIGTLNFSEKETKKLEEAHKHELKKTEEKLQADTAEETIAEEVG